MVNRGDIWLASLDPTIGSQINNMRPCVVVCPPEMHHHLRTVIVAPMTTGSKPAPFRVPITFDGRKGLILLDQIRTVDKRRLLKRVGAVRSNTLSGALAALQAVFAD